jgi:chromosomal replication initiation ATPase DnaA
VDLLVDKSCDRGAEGLVNDTNDLWKRCADALREQVSDATWRTWLTGLVPQAFDGDLLVLTAPSTLVRDRIENRFLGLIAAAVSDVAAQQVTVRLDVAEAAVAEPWH